MKTYTNPQNEIITKWESFKHPDNPNFMQKVFYMMVEKPDGRVSVCYHLGGQFNTKWIFNLSKAEILKRFTDDH